MRLIDNDTLQLVEFQDRRTWPRYAILSHTWGAVGDEVTFEEMTPDVSSSSVAQKPGFHKISETCRIARTQYDLKYSWVDTCCIDKSSSAELSEAINSMYRWYQDAAICFAYLSDWDGVLSGLHKSKWFQRGWTLQETIAPRQLCFFDAEWNARGTRAAYAHEISTATRIPREVLGGTLALDRIPIAARMLWASTRETTREEDMAYCLLGIFDINMPMLYGEGSRAFIRLQEEIIKHSPDTTIFAWTDPSDPREFSGLLASSPAHFRGIEHLSLGPLSLILPRDFSITNRGVRFKLRLSWDTVTRQAILPVGQDRYASERGVFLRQVGIDEFVRVRPDQFPTYLPPGDPSTQAYGVMKDLRAAEAYRAFYVAKTLSVAQHLTLQVTTLRFSLENTITIAGAEPYGSYSPAARTLYASYSGRFLGYIKLKPEVNGNEFEYIILVCECFNRRWLFGLFAKQNWGPFSDNFVEKWYSVPRGIFRKSAQIVLDGNVYGFVAEDRRITVRVAVMYEEDGALLQLTTWPSLPTESGVILDGDIHE